MPTLIAQPTRIEAAGNKPKIIDEYIGHVNTGTSSASVAHMRSPEGWVEPGQTPEFTEFTVVLQGLLRVQHKSGSLEVRAGQAVITNPGEWVRYSTPEAGGAEYMAVCLPAFFSANRSPRRIAAPRNLVVPPLQSSHSSGAATTHE